MKSMFTLLLFVPALLFSQSWEKTFGVGYGYCVQQTFDEGYVVAGFNGDYDAILIKTDIYGNSSWITTVGQLMVFESALYVEQTNDSGYIMAGWTGENTDIRRSYLVKTDRNGDTLWTRSYNYLYDNAAYNVHQTTDGGYYMSGWLTYSDTDDQFYAIKTDANGDTLWTHTYGDEYSQLGAASQETTDGGYILCGVTSTQTGNSDDVYLVKTDHDGNTEWTRTFGGELDDEGHSIQQTTDGGYIICGNTVMPGMDVNDVYLVKTDANGDMVWSRNYGGYLDDQGAFVRQTGDGGYIITGMSNSFSPDYDIYLIKTDALGDTLWTRLYGGDFDDYSFSVEPTEDGGYVISGWHATGVGLMNSYIYLIKTTANGLVTSTTEIPVTPQDRKVVKLIDLSGREIRQPAPHIPYLEVYSDGSSAKKILVK